ncbi:MAG TPA: EamA family transporter [Bryobacteraceae bacterium]|nr:EamA family transporter [Bryobacteraceae bacterium]
MTTPLSSILLVMLASFIGSFGAVLLKSGATKLKRQWRTLAYNWRLAAGIGSFLLSSIFFVMGVRHGELTVLYPINALGYIWTLVWSRLFFGEPFTRNKFLGLTMILLGVACLGLGSR